MHEGLEIIENTGIKTDRLLLNTKQTSRDVYNQMRNSKTFDFFIVSNRAFVKKIESKYGNEGLGLLFIIHDKIKNKQVIERFIKKIVNDKNSLYLVNLIHDCGIIHGLNDLNINDFQNRILVISSEIITFSDLRIILTIIDKLSLEFNINNLSILYRFFQNNKGILMADYGMELLIIYIDLVTNERKEKSYQHLLNRESIVLENIKKINQELCHSSKLFVIILKFADIYKTNLNSFTNLVNIVIFCVNKYRWFADNLINYIENEAREKIFMQCLYDYLVYYRFFELYTFEKYANLKLLNKVGSIEEFDLTLVSIKEKFINSPRSFRDSEYYEFLLKYVFPVGKYSNYDINLKSPDRDNVLSGLQCKKVTYSKDICGIDSFSLKQDMEISTDILDYGESLMNQFVSFFEGGHGLSSLEVYFIKSILKGNLKNSIVVEMFLHFSEGKHLETSTMKKQFLKYLEILIEQKCNFSNDKIKEITGKLSENINKMEIDRDKFFLFIVKQEIENAFLKKTYINMLNYNQDSLSLKDKLLLIVMDNIIKNVEKYKIDDSIILLLMKYYVVTNDSIEIEEFVSSIKTILNETNQLKRIYLLYSKILSIFQDSIYYDIFLPIFEGQKKDFHKEIFEQFFMQIKAKVSSKKLLTNLSNSLTSSISEGIQSDRTFDDILESSILSILKSFCSGVRYCDETHKSEIAYLGSKLIESSKNNLIGNAISNSEYGSMINKLSVIKILESNQSWKRVRHELTETYGQSIINGTIEIIKGVYGQVLADGEFLKDLKSKLLNEKTKDKINFNRIILEIQRILFRLQDFDEINSKLSFLFTNIGLANSQQIANEIVMSANALFVKKIIEIEYQGIEFSFGKDIFGDSKDGIGNHCISSILQLILRSNSYKKQLYSKKDEFRQYLSLLSVNSLENELLNSEFIENIAKEIISIKIKALSHYKNQFLLSIENFRKQFRLEKSKFVVIKSKKKLNKIRQNSKKVKSIVGIVGFDKEYSNSRMVSDICNAEDISIYRNENYFEIVLFDRANYKCIGVIMVMKVKGKNGQDYYLLMPVVTLGFLDQINGIDFLDYVIEITSEIGRNNGVNGLIVYDDDENLQKFCTNFYSDLTKAIKDLKKNQKGKKNNIKFKEVVVLSDYGGSRIEFKSGDLIVSIN